MARKQPKTPAAPPAPSGRLARRLIAVVLTFAAVAGLVWGIARLGDQPGQHAQEEGRGLQPVHQARYPTLASQVERPQADDLKHRRDAIKRVRIDAPVLGLVAPVRYDQRHLVTGLGEGLAHLDDLQAVGFFGWEPHIGQIN